MKIIILVGEKIVLHIVKPRCEGKSITSQEKNIVLFDISPEKFNQQIKIMLGEEFKNNIYNFENPNLIALNYYGISFSFMFKQICKIIDYNINYIETLEKTKFDELIYRTFVMMFLPKYFFNDTIIISSQSSPKLLPCASAICGIRLVGVIPGSVFASRQ